MALTLDILTPEKIVMQTQADAVVIPSADGELGILTNHAPLLAELQPGQVRVRRGDNVELFAVSGGFAEMRDNHLSIFAETAEMAQEIDIERARQAAEKARAALRSQQDGANLEQAEAALRRALARLRTFEGLRRRTSGGPAGRV
jgi:F-type H+-transporting ATPase subunit epsilon